MKIEKHILPKLGGICYEKLTADVFNAFVSDKLAAGLSAKYVSDISMLIKSVCKFAHRQYSYANKAKFMVLPKQEKRSDKKMLTAQEQDSLNTWFAQNIAPCNAGIMLSAATGIRIGELCALKWSDFDLEKSIFTVSKTMQRIKSHDTSGTKVIITLPKSRTSVREIPIPEFMKSILQQLKCGSDCFFLTGDSSFIEPRTIQYRFKSILKKLNLPHVNFHSLRHMFATKCVSLGVDVKTLSEILGHSSVKITLDRYVHSSIERKQSCMKLLSDSFCIG